MTERFQYVSAGGVLSGFLPVLRGVPQGSSYIRGTWMILHLTLLGTCPF
jgi:hypothetical protein